METQVRAANPDPKKLPSHVLSYAKRCNGRRHLGRKSVTTLQVTYGTIVQWDQKRHLMFAGENFYR